MVATIPPLASLAEELGGGRLAVESLLGPRSDPEAASLSLSAVRSLADADVVVALGGGTLPLERQLLPTLQDADRRLVLVVPEDDGVPARRPSHAHDGHEDPHAWLDPDRMLDVAHRLARHLSERDRAGAPVYDRELVRFVERVRRADRELRARLSTGDALLLSEHPTWEVLERRYGVRVLAIEQEERDASARRIAEVVELARDANVDRVAVAAGGSHRLARALAREIGATVVELEPLAYDWIGSLERAAAVAVLDPAAIEPSTSNG